MSVSCEKIAKLNYQLLEKVRQYIENIEKNLTYNEIIRFRESLLCDIIQHYSTWRNSFDCLPTFVKVGPFGNHGVELIPKE